MKRPRNNSTRASTLQIALSTVLIPISAILLAIATPASTKEAPRQDLYGFQLEEGAGADSTAALGNYPDTSIPLSTNTTASPDDAPTNITNINVSTSTNFKGKLEGDPMTGVVRVTNAHPEGTYTVTLTAFDSGGALMTKTFRLTVTTPVTCTPVSFAAATDFGGGGNPYSVAVGDFNGDGKQDLALANYYGSTVSILLGDGAGGFSAATDFGVGKHAESVAVGDFNGDGKQDLAVASSASSDVSILLGDGAGSFSAATNFGVGSGQYSVAVGDFNGDGKQDVVVAIPSSNDVSTLLGDGAGSFSAATNFGAGSSPYSVAVGDFNGDGKQDLAVANYLSNDVSVLIGNGAGSFSAATNFGAGSRPYSVAVGDFDGDGKQDLAVANASSNDVSILLGDGAGSFSVATSFAAGGNLPLLVVVGDFNGDGKQDLATANGNNVSILLGDGRGSFSAATNFSAGDGPDSVAVGDFNGDGKQDLAAATYFGGVSILLRDCAATPTPTPTPSPLPGGCVLSSGYWMNHPAAWCMETVQIECVTYTQSQAIAIMRHSTGNDKTYALAQQLIAAKLNLACKHSNTSCVASLIAAADSWLCAHPVGSGVSGGSSAWQQIKATHSALGKYNEGKSCAPSCDVTH